MMHMNDPSCRFAVLVHEVEGANQARGTVVLDARSSRPWVTFVAVDDHLCDGPFDRLPLSAP